MAEEQERFKTQVEANVARINLIIVAGIIIGLIVAIGLGTFMSLAISRSISGNVDNLALSANQLTNASMQVSSSSQELSSGASELASSVEEMTSSIEELQSIIESNTKNINEGKGMSDAANREAKESTKLMEELESNIDEIDENSRKVAKVIKVIDDIAFQTNILALNAAVEAARAGDAGRGFAVVAEQVKNLAQKSAEAAKETAVLIENAMNSVTAGKGKTRTVKESSVKSGEGMDKIATIMDEVSRGSQEQLKGANQVTKAISQINSVVQQTASTSEENAAAGEELLAQAETLKGVVIDLNEIVKGKGAKIEGLKTKSDNNKIQVLQDKPKPQVTEKRNLRLSHKDEGVEIIKPEDKIPLEDFKDF
jgi:methyl-accepting chemotaxis protein